MKFLIFLTFYLLSLLVSTVFANDKNTESKIDSIAMTQQVLEHEGLKVYWNSCYPIPNYKLPIPYLTVSAICKALVVV